MMMPRDPLERYWRILEGEDSAKFLIAKGTMIEADLLSDTGTLWDIHALKAPQKGSNGNVSFLDLKSEIASRSLDNCTLCERRCGANRLAGEVGHCGVLGTRISSEFLHLGEEPELVPSHTIFFSGCTFDCVYCQNADISTHPESGIAVTPEQLSKTIGERARVDAKASRHLLTPMISRNVNWVGGDPTSNLPYILRTLSHCDVNLPQIWNSNMYMTETALKLLDGVIDVYLTDFKYGNDECAKRLSNVDRYTEVIRRNHLAALDQAEMIVRHLVLPSHLECCTRPVLNWIAENLEGVKVNVMGQYHPAHRSSEFEELLRPLKGVEYRSALRIAEDLGLHLCG